MKSTGVYRCPDDSFSPSAAGDYAISYSYNYGLTRKPTSGNGVGGTISSISAPSNTVLLLEVTGCPARLTDPSIPTSGSGAEGNGSQSAGMTGYYSPVSEGYSINVKPSDSYFYAGDFATGYLSNRGVSGFPAQYAGTKPTGRHTDGSDFAFVDGHVKWLRGSQVSSWSGAVNPADPQQGGNAAGTADTTGRFAGTFSPI